jgi:hypothetical protein
MAQKTGSEKKTTDGERWQACPVAFCPVGMLLTLTGQARPEVVEHLMNAGREIMLAAASFMNTRVEQLQERPRLEKIQID